MAGYLDSYGVADQKRERLRKRTIIVVASAVVVALALFVVFHNFQEKRVVHRFLNELKAGRYQEAYNTWGCTTAAPCRDYAFAKFMEDWGPKGGYANVKQARIPIIDSCGNGVVMTLEIPNVEPFGLFVERDTKTLSFAPWPRCPGRHWHFWEFIQRQFS